MYAILTGIIYSIGIKYFIRPSGIILTGTEGIAIATSYFLNSESIFIVLYSIFQALLLAFSFKKIGPGFSLKTLITVVSVVLLLIVLPAIEIASQETHNERIVLVLFGAIIMGSGKALALRNRGSTGDEDIIAVYFSEKLRKPVGKIVIIAGSIAMVYGLTLDYAQYHSVARTFSTLMYTSIFIYMTAQTINMIYKRYKFSSIQIITENADEIEEVLAKIIPERSFTRTKAIGSYSGTEKDLLIIILTQEELPEVLASVRETDGKCFVFYHELQGIQGRFNYREF